MKKEIREIESNIRRLLMGIEKLRRDPREKQEYRRKLKQLMYWRRRRNQMGADHGRDTDEYQSKNEERNVSSVWEGGDGDSDNIKYEENPF